MEQICPNPKCNSPLHAIIADEDGVQRQVLWCMACSSIADKPATVRPNIPTRPSSVLRIRARLAGSWNEKEFHRWELFEAVLQNYESDGVNLKEVYQIAREYPGQWLVTATPVTRSQFFRALIGLSWDTCEPPMAVRCNVDGSVDLAMNAYKVMTRQQAVGGWWDLVCASWKVQYYDRVEKKKSDPSA